MGLLLSRILSLIQSKKPCKIFMIGLDGAGKTTVLYRLKLGEVVVTIPTIGFNLETVEYKNISFNVWDVGGGEKLRPLYRHYAAEADAIVYVVDSNDSARLAEAKDELNRMINIEEVAGCPLLVLANKRDLPNAAPLATITESLGLHNLEREWHIQPTCVTTSEGLYEGLDWLAGKLS